MWSLLFALTASAAPEAPLCPAAEQHGLRRTDSAEVYAGWERAEAFDTHAPSLQALQELVARFERRGTHVVALLLPTRPLASSSTIPDWDRPKALRSYEALRHRLSELEGLTVIDGLQVANDLPGFYFPREHHWTPEGARASATLVGAAATLLPALDRVPHAAYRSVPGEPQTRLGNISVQVTRWCEHIEHPALTYTPWSTAPVVAPGVLDEVPPPPIVALGTSNLDADWNFAGFLEESTGVDVLNAGLGGGHALGAWLQWLQSDDGTRAPAMLVWEVEAIDLDATTRPAYPGFQDPRAWSQLLGLATGPCEGSALAEGGASLDGLDLHEDVAALRMSFSGPVTTPITVRVWGRERTPDELELPTWTKLRPSSVRATTLPIPRPTRIEVVGGPQPVKTWLCPSP